MEGKYYCKVQQKIGALLIDPRSISSALLEDQSRYWKGASALLHQPRELGTPRAPLAW